eukprot:549512_1
MEEEKKSIDNFDDEDECDQESIVHANGDHRHPITESDRKREYIIRCIGQLEVNFKYVDKGYDQAKSQWGTGTVFYTNPENTKCYVLSCAHNVTKVVFECKICGKYSDKNENDPTCKHCNSPEIKRSVINATKIRFRRREIERRTTVQNEDNETVICEFGDNKQCYMCDIEYIHYRYYTHPFTTASFDWCILSFANSDKYNYLIYSRNIKIRNNLNLIQNKTLSTFHIFGYPMTDVDKRNKMYGDQSSGQNYLVATSKHSQKNYLRQQEVDTTGGESGAVIWYKDNENVDKNGLTTVFGIHTAGNSKKRFNVATLIDDMILGKIEQIRVQNEVIPVVNTISYKNGNSYIGEVDDKNDPNGYGIYYYANGAKYEGAFKNGRKHGFGKYIDTTGYLFDGRYENGKANGYGKQVSKSGNVYEGEFKDGKRNGNGKMKYKKAGAVYTGNWKNGKMEGKGKYCFSSGEVYEGNWVNDKREGYGKAIFADGNIYEGYWKGGLKHGQGKYVGSNGYLFEGQYEKDKANGYGNQVSKTGNVYEGVFKNGKKNGQGKMAFKKSGAVYTGNWKNNCMEGKGKYVFSSGDMYDGQWVKEKREGYGKTTYANGHTHEGYWKGGTRNGQAKYIGSNGYLFEGQYEKDKANGYGNQVSKTGNVYEGVFKNGKKNGQGKMAFKKSGAVYTGN